MRHFKLIFIAATFISSCQRPDDAASVARVAGAETGTESTSRTAQPANGILVSGPASEFLVGMAFSIDKRNWNEGRAYVVSITQELSEGIRSGGRLAIRCGEKTLGQLSPSARLSQVSLQVQVPAGACSAADLKYQLDGFVLPDLGRLSLLVLELGPEL